MATKPIGERGGRGDSSLESELRRIVKEGVEEAHDEGVQHGTSNRGGGGRSRLPLLFVASALGVAAVLLWRRSGSTDSGATGAGKHGIESEASGIVERLRTTVERAAEQTDEVSERVAVRVDEGGETVAERTKSLSETAAQGVAEGGKTAAEQTEAASDQAAERVEERGEEAASRMEDAAESDDESDTTGSQ